MVAPPPNGELEALLEYLYERRNFDFRGYKRASLTRRIFKRMQMINVDDYQRYMEILEANPGEFAELFNTILINVTSFVAGALKRPRILARNTSRPGKSARATMLASSRRWLFK